ncbi:MAG: ribonuclease HII [Chloroflexi bacterium]|nr:ribonuclease HII [Chloroflexota bacterium]
MANSPTFREELAFHAQGLTLVAGIDEVGRGPLAGPVVAGSVILPSDWFRRNGTRRRKEPACLLNDSKQLSADQRETLYPEITSRAVAWGISVVSVGTIDRVGIGAATLLAMRQAVAAMARAPQALLVDGLQGLPELGLPCKAIVDGDARCGSIAAASIVAKVTRDRLMREMDARYPGYGFAGHKGYGTAEHLERLRALGPCPEHRRSFAPVADMLMRPRLL